MRKTSKTASVNTFKGGRGWNDEGVKPRNVVPAFHLHQNLARRSNRGFFRKLNARLMPFPPGSKPGPTGMKPEVLLFRERPVTITSGVRF